MPSKHRRRYSAARPLIALLLLVFAGYVGWQFLRPRASRPPSPHPLPRGSAPVMPTPISTPMPTASPTATPSLLPSATASAAALASPLAGAPKLAIIIDDCGQWLSIERGFLKLPVPITLAVLPYVHGTQEIATQAHRAGKGVMLHLPMQPISHLYPGPGEITTSMSDAQIIAQTQADLAQVPFAQGVNNHEGSAATANPRVMRAVVSVLARDHLFFIDSRTNAASVAATIAHNAGLASASRNVFLDNKANLAYTQGELREAIRIAKAHGTAIAIGHPRATTLAAIRSMLPEIASDGITLVLARELAIR